MFKDADKIIDLIIEFCRDNLNILMIGGIALIVVVIVISILKGYDEDDDEYDDDDDEYDDDDFDDELDDEPEYDEPVAVVKITPVEDHAQEQVTAPILEPTEVPIIEPVESGRQKGTHHLDEIIGEIANIPSEGVKKLEIKIQGAELKITYSDLREEILLCGTEDSEEPDEEQLEGQTEVQPEESGEHEEANPAETSSEQGKTYTKFGPGNNNVTKSGRVYTEEELEKQIKD